MTTQEGPKRKMSAAKPEQKSKVALEKAKARALARVKAEEQVRLKAAEAPPEPPEALAAAQAEAEQEGQAQGEGEETPTEAQEVLVTPQAEIEPERQARVKAGQARVETERALTEVKKATGVEAAKMEPPPSAPGEGGAEQPVTFVVRLTVGERGQPRRTEVVHAQSGKKEIFPSLDVHRLAAFMQACLSSPAVPEPAIPPAPLPKVEALLPEPPRLTSGLILSAVQVLHIGASGGIALTLGPDEAFMVQAHFQIQGPQASALTTQAPSFQVQVYTHEVTSGMARLLTTYRGNLVKDVLEYTAQMQAPGLSPGLYRLVTLVNLQEPVKMLGHREGPIVQVTGVGQSTPNLLVGHT